MNSISALGRQGLGAAAMARTLASGDGAAFEAAVTRMRQLAAASCQHSAPRASDEAALADLEASSLASQVAMTRVAGSEAAGGSPSLRQMLEARYPGIHYHVFDASSSNWKTRTDYPHYLLYQDGDMAKKTLENWKPEGENPFYGSKDGQFIASKEIRTLEHVAPGSKAVVIHPKVQERMEADPAYANEIFERIQAWFALDVARNDVIRAAHGDGSCEGIISQAVAIGEDGNICNAQASSQGTITVSSSGPDGSRRSGRPRSGWEARLARHDEYMARVVEKQIEHKQELSRESNGLAARKAILARMLQKHDLAKVLGRHVAGMPTADFLSLVRSQALGAQMATV